jgi:hypothetical protein
VSEVATSESDAELIARLRSEIAALNAELVDARQSLARLRTAHNKALEEQRIERRTHGAARWSDRGAVAKE